MDSTLDISKGVNDITKELLVLKEIMETIDNMTDDQGEDIDAVKEKTVTADTILDDGNNIIEQIEPVKHNKHLSAVVIIGGGLLGALGFIINPFVGIGTVAVGVGTGLVVAHKKFRYY
jgi:hypothetical protein